MPVRDVADPARKPEVAADRATHHALGVGLGLEVAAADRTGADGVDRARLLDGVEDALLHLADARHVRRAVRRRVVEERLELRVELRLRQVVRVGRRVEQRRRVVDEVGEEGRRDVSGKLLRNAEDSRGRDGGSGRRSDALLRGSRVASCGNVGKSAWLGQ